MSEKTRTMAWHNPTPNHFLVKFLPKTKKAKVKFHPPAQFLNIC